MLAELFTGFDTYDLWLAVFGLAILAAAILPKLLERYPLSMPIVLLLIGFLTGVSPLGLEGPDPARHGRIIEHFTELGVIVTLMGAGLKIDRPFSWRGWKTTLRLLGVTMTMTIALTAFLGWGLAGFLPATAVLFGAVIAPTDPVLASDVQVGAPGEGIPEDKNEEREEEEIRFALTLPPCSSTESPSLSEDTALSPSSSAAWSFAPTNGTTSTTRRYICFQKR